MANPIYGAFSAYPARFENENADFQRLLHVAHSMIETYCNKDFPLFDIHVSYTISTPSDPLMAIENYPINEVKTVKSVDGDDLPFGYTDELIFSTTADRVWAPGRLARAVVYYIGGIPSQVYDAVLRQGKVLETRPNIAPEIGDSSVPYDVKLNASMRSGLSPDVKQMVFPFKRIEF